MTLKAYYVREAAQRFYDARHCRRECLHSLADHCERQSWAFLFLALPL